MTRTNRHLNEAMQVTMREKEMWNGETYFSYWMNKQRNWWRRSRRLMKEWRRLRWEESEGKGSGEIYLQTELSSIRAQLQSAQDATAAKTSDYTEVVAERDRLKTKVWNGGHLRLARRYYRFTSWIRNWRRLTLIIKRNWLVLRDKYVRRRRKKVKKVKWMHR